MPAFFSARRQPGWLAILPQGKRIALAHAVRGHGVRPEIRLLDSFAVATTELDALRRLLSARQLKRYACTTVMPARQYDVVALEAPNVPRHERKQALRWALKASVDYPLESACLDELEIPLASAGQKAMVFAVAAAESGVRECAALFERARVPLAAIDIAELAQRNVSALLEEQDRGLTLLHLDESGGLLTLTFHGELIAVRRIGVSALQLAESDSERRAQLLERLVLELQRSLDNFDRQYSAISIAKLVLAAYPPVHRLAAELGESLYLPVCEMDLAPVINFPQVPELRDTRRQAQNLLAIGAALRSEVLA